LGVSKPKVNGRFNAQLFKYFASRQAVLDKLLKITIIQAIGLFTPRNTSGHSENDKL
jgi:hypothetical protein